MKKAKLTYKELEDELKQLKIKLSKLSEKEQKLIEAKKNAEESANTLLNISNNIPAYIAIVDSKTLKYTFVNSQFIKGFNKKREEIIGMHISEIIGKANTEFAMQFINQVKKGKSASYINTFDLAEGKRYVNVNYAPSFNKIGEVQDIIVLSHDITSIKQSELELKKAKKETQGKEQLLLEQNKKLEIAKIKAEESERRYKALHDATSGGIGIHNKGFILDCNQGLADMTGYTVRQLIGMNGLLLIAEKSRDEVMHNILSGYEKPYEVIGLRKNGEEYPLQIEGRMIPYNGEMVRVVEFRDITQQKRNEQKLIEQNEKYEILNKELINTNEKLLYAKHKAEESEEQLKLIANNFVDGMIYQVAMLDKAKRKFNYISDTVLKLYGCTPEEAKENSDLIYSKIHPDDIEGLIEKEQEALKNMSVFKTEARVINPDGSIRWSYYISQPRIINNIVCWDGIDIDITERKNLEQDLINAKNKAEESDRLKSAFLSNMSHEIRTPMNSIMGFSQLLKASNISNEEKEKYIEFINNGGNRLLTIISDIVDLSKIDARQLSLNIKPCNLNQLIENIYNQFLISDHNSEVTIKTFKGLSNSKSNINTDSTRLTQILSNLLENALKFTHEGTVEFGYIVKNKFLEFYVKDTGIGIDPKYHNLIFDRFRQVNDDFFKTGSGTGLGLSIVMGLVDLLQGKIWVESEIHNGTTFYFTLPFIDN
ncbi:MAG: PAS domain S-box protein [Salinivirgaceae bacterium]|jgi:PAS domain S-box-containing protein|nr:PAS domain S-box protein [Salinivirgaceae bacterium]